MGADAARKTSFSNLARVEAGPVVESVDQIRDAAVEILGQCVTLVVLLYLTFVLLQIVVVGILDELLDLGRVLVGIDLGKVVEVIEGTLGFLLVDEGRLLRVHLHLQAARIVERIGVNLVTTERLRVGIILERVNFASWVVKDAELLLRAGARLAATDGDFPDMLEEVFELLAHELLLTTLLLVVLCVEGLTCDFKVPLISLSFRRAGRRL